MTLKLVEGGVLGRVGMVKRFEVYLVDLRLTRGRQVHKRSGDLGPR